MVEVIINNKDIIVRNESLNGCVSGGLMLFTVLTVIGAFATLTQEEQKFANIFLNDVQRGAVQPEKGKTFRSYITEYLATAKSAQIDKIVNLLGKPDDETMTAFKRKLRRMMDAGITEANINDFGRFDDLKQCVDTAKAKAYFEALEGTRISVFKVNIKVDGLLQQLIIRGGVE